MKRFFLFLLLVGLARVTANAAAIESYNLLTASYTETTDTIRNIPQTPPGTIFMGVVVGSTGTLQSGTLKVYNSSGTATNQITSITLNSLGVYPFEVLLSSGLSYATTTSNSAVTILYKKTRPQ